MSYYERLKQRSTSASELEENKRRMSQGPTIEELERRLQEAEQSFTDAAEYLNVPAQEIPVDDGAPPSPPSGVLASPFFHQLDVTWSEPPADDHVVRVFVRVGEKSRGAAGKSTTEATMFGAALTDLPTTVHTVEVFFEDRWGRQSDWSAVVEATPLLTAAESIDLTAAQIAGSLGWENLDPLNDPANLGNDVVTARAMATQNLAATRAWIGDAAIDTAMIVNLSADKLTAGVFTAGQITLAGGGSLKAGQTTLDSGGISLAATDANAAPAASRDYKISVSGDWGAIGFFRAQGANARGIQLRVDGAGSDNMRGQIALQATAAGSLGRLAGLDCYAGPSYTANYLYADTTSIRGDLNVSGRLGVDGKIVPRWLFVSTIPPNSWLRFIHNLGDLPAICTWYLSTPGANDWRQLPTSPTAEGIDVYVRGVGTNDLYVQNNSGNRYNLRGYVG